MDLACGKLEQQPSTSAEYGKLPAPLQQFSTAVNHGNLTPQAQQLPNAYSGNLVRHKKWLSAASNQGNLGSYEQESGAAVNHSILQSYLGRHEQRPSFAADSSDVNHAGNPDVHPGTGSALSTNHPNILSVNYAHSSCVDFTQLSASPDAVASNISGNVCDTRWAKSLVDESYHGLQTNLRVDTDNISDPADASCPFDAHADSLQRYTYVVMATPATSAAVTTSPTFSRPTVSVSSSGQTTTRFMPYGASSAVSTLTCSAPHVTSPSIVTPPPPHSSVHSPWPSGPSTPRRPLLQVEPFRLDKFSGNIEEWPGFWKQFDVAVDSQDYSDIKKINLLYQCLVGKAKLRVAGIPRAEENYALVKNLLREAYDRPDRLLRNLMQKLEELRIPHNTPSDLEAFHIELESICHQLEAMGHNVNNLSTRLTIQKRLPRNLLQRWMETSAVDERMWTTDFLRDKLRHQVDIFESLGDYHHEPHYTGQSVRRCTTALDYYRRRYLRHRKSLVADGEKRPTTKT